MKKLLIFTLLITTNLTQTSTLAKDTPFIKAYKEMIAELKGSFDDKFDFDKAKKTIEQKFSQMQSEAKNSQDKTTCRVFRDMTQTKLDFWLKTIESTMKENKQKAENNLFLYGTFVDQYQKLMDYIKKQNYKDLNCPVTLESFNAKSLPIKKPEDATDPKSGWWGYVVPAGAGTLFGGILGYLMSPKQPTPPTPPSPVKPTTKAAETQTEAIPTFKMPKIDLLGLARATKDNVVQSIAVKKASEILNTNMSNTYNWLKNAVDYYIKDFMKSGRLQSTFGIQQKDNPTENDIINARKELEKQQLPDEVGNPPSEK
ncbi:MAG: hypothetical protein UR26_C0003G0092 [candidate division TM6 bacterium GW2011_GWF2_32_72]|nr:MAG: hypothetical protein UR26_C0003G0092 [candidate division TM6 bacterium GW2011_GWF2_32_72]